MGLGSRCGVFWIALGAVWAVSCAVYDSSLLEDEDTTDSVGGSGGSATGGGGGEPSTGGVASGGVATGGSDSGGTGSVATGAQGGEGGMVDPGPPLPGPWLFPTDLDGWELSYISPLSVAPTASHDGAVGDPALGSVLFTASFDDVEQKFTFATTFPDGVDLSGATVTARIRLESGLSSDVNNPGGAQIYVKTGDDFAYAKGQWTSLLPTGWRTLKFIIDSPAAPIAPTYDPTKVVELGIEVATGSAGSSYQSATIHLDSVKLTR